METYSQEHIMELDTEINEDNLYYEPEEEETPKAYAKYSNEWKRQNKIPVDAFYSVMKLGFQPSEEVLRMLIGNKGCYFIKTTQLSGVYFIWNDRANFPDEIEIYGPDERSIEDCKSRIWKRCFGIIDRLITSKKSVSQSEYEWASTNYHFFKNLPHDCIVYNM